MTIEEVEEGENPNGRVNTHGKVLGKTMHVEAVKGLTRRGERIGRPNGMWIGRQEMYRCVMHKTGKIMHVRLLDREEGHGKGKGA